MKNGAEADIDCGGPCTTKCADAKACAVAGDCVSGVCTSLLCAQPSCTDVVKNGTEPDVDCGSTCATRCATGKGCVTGLDCVGGVCSANVCEASCTDTLKNGSETDVDCGGPACGKCSLTKACAVDTDCSPNECANLVCIVPTCMNLAKDGAETDVDCGGSKCGGCADAKVCSVGHDCTSGGCNAGLCGVADNEPTNDTCAGASPEALPATVASLQLPTLADVDWFLFTAAASDVGKKVHVVTISSGLPHPCDTIVEVFVGGCASLTTLGGQSDDNNYSENWLSAPLTAAGPFWVKVSYSNPFTIAPYSLSVSTQ